MKKIIFIITVLITMTLLNGRTLDTDKGKNSIKAGTLTISFDLYRINKIASNQIAVWVEDSKGNYIDTIYVSKFTAAGGYAKRETSLPEWVKKSQVKKLTTKEIDAITGPTKQAGKITLSWNCLDKQGNKLGAGKYVCRIEGNIFWANIIMFNGEFEIGNNEFVSEPAPIYIGDDAKKDKLIENVKIIYTPFK